MEQGDDDAGFEFLKDGRDETILEDVGTAVAECLAHAHDQNCPQGVGLSQADANVAHEEVMEVVAAGAFHALSYFCVIHGIDLPDALFILGREWGRAAKEVRDRELHESIENAMLERNHGQNPQA